MMMMWTERIPFGFARICVVYMSWTLVSIRRDRTHPGKHFAMLLWTKRNRIAKHWARQRERERGSDLNPNPTIHQPLSLYTSDPTQMRCPEEINYFPCAESESRESVSCVSVRFAYCSGIMCSGFASVHA